MLIKTKSWIPIYYLMYTFAKENIKWCHVRCLLHLENKNITTRVQMIMTAIEQAAMHAVFN